MVKKEEDKVELEVYSRKIKLNQTFLDFYKRETGEAVTSDLIESICTREYINDPELDIQGISFLVKEHLMLDMYLRKRYERQVTAL